MHIHEVKVMVDLQENTTLPGLKQGAELFQAFQLSDNQHLLLEVTGDIDIPVALEDYILVVGGENFSVAQGISQIEDNPRLRHPIRFTLNEKLVGEHQALHHPKIWGADLKRLAHESQEDSILVADLEGIADVVIGAHQRLIVKPTDQFLVIPQSDAREHHHHDVMVKINGNQVTLAAGNYLVSTLKQILGVPAEYELDLVVQGVFHPLSDADHFKLHKPEEFVSHARTGSSS